MLQIRQNYAANTATLSVIFKVFKLCNGILKYNTKFFSIPGMILWYLWHYFVMPTRFLV